MKAHKYVLCSLLLILVICITGCGKNETSNEESKADDLSKDELLCQVMTPNFEKFENHQITYEDFLSIIKDDYNSYCNNSDSLCGILKSMYSSNAEIEEFQIAEISSLKRRCESIKK